MGLFKTKHTMQTDESVEAIDLTWPDDTLDGVDDDAFAEAIASARVADAEHEVTVAA